MENENEYEYFCVNDSNGYGCYVDIESKYMLSDVNDIIYLRMNENTMKIEQTESLMDKLYPRTIQNIIYKTQKRPTSERLISERPISERPISERLISERPTSEQPTREYEEDTHIQNNMQQPFINHIIWSIVIVYICLNF